MRQQIICRTGGARCKSLSSPSDSTNEPACLRIASAMPQAANQTALHEFAQTDKLSCLDLYRAGRCPASNLR
jgi:hypothetical protein